MHDSLPGDRGRLGILLLSTALLLAGLTLYAQTQSFAWDEGFHLLAAQLILAGKRPYLDFCFPQTPLNAYATAGWMRVFGQTWRASHVLETLCVAAAAFLTADYVRARFPVPAWRTAGSLAALVAVGMNAQVITFGTLGQSYGLCLFLAVAAFRVAIAAVERVSAWPSAAAGFLAGAAAGTSLLSAPLAPVLFLWVGISNRAGSRWAKMGAMISGGLVSWLPVVWLYHEGPRQTLFNIVLYQFKYRHKWNGATAQDISALTAWINSAQGLALALLTVVALWFLLCRCDWTREQRSEFHLSLWVAWGITMELATAHPTFERYFLLVVPFVAIPAIAGLYTIGIRLWGPGRPFPAVAILMVILILGLARNIYDDHDSYSWADVEKIAQRVDQVSPPHAVIWADELIYFLIRRPPPDGMEFAYAHDIQEMPAAQTSLLHILTGSQLRRRAAAGAYQTVAACYDTDNTDAAKVPDLYRNKDTVRDCTIYWDFAGGR